MAPAIEVNCTLEVHPDFKAVITDNAARALRAEAAATSSHEFLKGAEKENPKLEFP